MMRPKYAAVSLLVIICLMFLVSTKLSDVRCTVIGSLGKADLSVYVVALDDVSGHLVKNVSRTVEGVLAACDNDKVSFLVDFGLTEELELNVSVSIVKDWSVYEAVVESCANSVIVNAHGETVPVPADYTKEEWVDEIAEAMASRNVTWVHTGGYPFYYYQVENDLEHEWGVDGFKRLMSHMGLQNVTCWPSVSQETKTTLHTDADAVSTGGWHDIGNAFKAELGRPIDGLVFSNYVVSCIWGDPAGEMTGAVVKFAETAGAKDFGFYVHIGTNSTFREHDELTDGDYYRGYVGAAQAIYTTSLRNTASNAMSEAQEAISTAEDEGRTSSLGEARQLLQQSKGEYTQSDYYSAVKSANLALQTANNSINNFFEAYIIPMVIAGVIVGSAGTTTAMILVKRQKKNLKQKE
jgi:hypothetical protein